jgi:dolichol-phosphate mannosyltransferase
LENHKFFKNNLKTKDRFFIETSLLTPSEMLEYNPEMLDITVVIPTYNERENIKKLIPLVSEALRGYSYEVIVVDDSSPDGTAEAAKELANNYPVKVITRPEKLGLSSAVVEGFKISLGENIGVIDADLQHPPEELKNLVQALLNGYDIAVGSRYVNGGKIEGWSKFRYVVSRGATILSAPLTDVKDSMSGYFFLKRKVISNVSFSPAGYKILLEILVKGSYNKVKEIPYTFKLRESGKSKLDTGEYVNYLKLLYYLYGFRLKMILYKR